MKYALPTLLMLSLSMNASAQKISETEVPQPVRAAFQKQFPSAQKVKWEMEDKTKYEAVFRQNGTESSATFDASGSWLETESAIKESDLPAAVRATLAAQYPGHKLEEFERLQTPEGTLYEVEAEKGEHSVIVKFAADGNVLKVAEVEEENGEGDDEEKD